MSDDKIDKQTKISREDLDSLLKEVRDRLSRDDSRLSLFLGQSKQQMVEKRRQRAMATIQLPGDFKKGALARLLARTCQTEFFESDGDALEIRNFVDLEDNKKNRVFSLHRQTYGLISRQLTQIESSASNPKYEWPSDLPRFRTNVNSLILRLSVPNDSNIFFLCYQPKSKTFLREEVIRLNWLPFVSLGTEIQELDKPQDMVEGQIDAIKLPHQICAIFVEKPNTLDSEEIAAPLDFSRILILEPKQFVSLLGFKEDIKKEAIAISDEFASDLCLDKEMKDILVGALDDWRFCNLVLRAKNVFDKQDIKKWVERANKENEIWKYDYDGNRMVSTFPEASKSSLKQILRVLARKRWWCDITEEVIDD